MFHNHAWVKYSLKGKDRPEDFKITEYDKLCFYIPTFQLIFEKLPLVEFWYSTIEEYS